MTTIQKTLVAATLVTAISAGIYEARLASNLRIETQGLRRQQTLVTERMRQLQSRHDAATNRLAALGNEIARMENNNTELLRLRGEVARLRQDSQELARLRMPAAGREAPLEDESWLERVRLLKQRLAQTPEAQIPEHQYLTDEDWLMAAKHKLDTEGDFRTAFSALDLAAEGQFLRLAEKALTRYLEANKGEFPTELLQLKAFFESPPGDDVLQRYEVVPGKSLPQVGLSGNPRDWLITSKYPRGEGQWALGRDGLSGFANPQELKVLAPAIKALYDASPVINGRKSIDIHQLPPYLTTPEQQAAYQKLIEGQGNRSAAK